MKNLLTFLILLGLLFPTTVAHTQSCLPDGITFTTQGQIDSFSINYPGCTEIGGDVTIGGLPSNYSITNLDGLANLTSFGGDLNIRYNNVLTNLDGLTNISSIGGDLAIDNKALTNLDGLANLTSIGGYLYIGSNHSLTNLNGLVNLTSIGGHLSIWNNNALADINGFTNLVSIDGYTKILQNDILSNIDGLASLTSIGGSLQIRNNDMLTSLDGLASLTSIAGDLEIRANDTLSNIDGFTSLTTIEGKLRIMYCPALTNLDGLANLTSIGELLEIENNGTLTNLDGLANLTAIGGALYISYNDALTNIDGLVNLTAMEWLDISHNDALTNIDGLVNLTAMGRLEISHNDALTNIDGLVNLTAMGRLEILHNDALTNINGLTNLTSIGTLLLLTSNPALTNIDGLANLTSVESLVIGAQPLLTNIDSLANLTSIGKLTLYANNLLTNIDVLANLTSIESLFINYNDALTNIDGLANLTSISSNLDIGSNAALTNLDGLANLTSIGGNLYLIDNNILTNCCAIQDLLATTGAIGGNISIHGNPSECSNESEILAASCAPIPRLITSKVFFDVNQNKLCDPDEGGIPGQKIWFNPPGQTFLTNQDGKYHKLCDSGTVYQLSWVEDPDWSLTTDSTSYQFTFTPGLPSNQTKDFGLYPNFTKHEGKINLSSNQTRCNTDVKFFLRMENSGTYIESGYALLHYDPSCTFISATPLTDAVVDTVAYTVVWYYDSLYPFQYQDIEIVFGMPDQNSTNTPLQFLSEMHGDSSGTNILLDSYNYTPIVRCSFDPNDKQVMPSGERDEHYTLHDQKLTYTIRFQNTGNAEAIDIRILDTLDADLDINTLRIVNSSFPVQTSIKDQAMEFFFKNIWLPDSTSNEPESHGFVTYEIQPKAGLADYTKIKNTAYIIFDFNDAIVTNTTKNTMVTTIPVALNEPDQTQISITPNPANNLIYISAKNQQIIDKVLIYSNLGDLVLTQKGAQVDVSHLPKGLYLVKVQAGEKMGVAKLIRL